MSQNPGQYYGPQGPPNGGSYSSPPPGWGQPQTGGPNDYQQQGPPGGWAQPQGQAPQGPPPGGWAQGGPVQGQQAGGNSFGNDEPDAFKAADSASGGGENPKLHQLEGRLILFRPTGLNPMAPGYNGGTPGPQITAEAIVFDGPPIEGVVNGKTHQMTPFSTGPRVTPFYIPTLYLRHEVVIKQLESAVAGREFRLGRITRGQAKGGNDAPFIIADMTEQDQAQARQILGPSIQAGWDRIKAEFQRYVPQPGQQQQGQQQQGPATYSPIQAQQTGNGWGQQGGQGQGPYNAGYDPSGDAYKGQPGQGSQQGPPPGWGQPTGQQGPPPGWGGQQ